MNRIFVKQGLSLFGITLLLLAGLAGCGGDEAAPVARPPAPPPAPPAFTPEAVEVALGESGDSATLMTTEAGGFTLDGEAFESGAMVTAENGNVYTLTLADGAWTAVFNAPEVEVMLGMSGSSVTIVTAEDGTYWVGTDELMSGGMVMADNGNYTLTLADGEWMAAFNPPMVDVMLGMHGGTVTIVTAEDGTYWVGTDELMDGGMVMGENGMYYTLSMADGEWMSAFQAPDPEMVTLGTSGTTITIETAENGTYWVAGALFESGGTVTAENGNMYMVTQVDGEWSSAFQAESMEIMGLDLMAMSTQDGDGYSVGDQMLDENGSGDIMVDGDHFRVSMDEDGMFMAMQFDAESMANEVDRDGALFEGTNADDDDTPMVNEAGTMLSVGGNDHSIGTLYGSGMSVIEGENIVEKRKDEIVARVNQIKGLIAVNEAEAASDDPETPFTDEFDTKWMEIDEQIRFIFGDDDTNAQDALDHLEPRPGDTDEMVEMLDKIVAALSSLEAFEASLDEDDGFFGDKGIADDEIAGVFDAVEEVSTVHLRMSENTRFGVYSKVTRPGNDATADLAPEVDSNGDATMAQFGAFAYSPHETSALGDLPTSGEAYYMGETIAQDHSEDFNTYIGMIEIRVRFRSRSVSGLVSGLMGADGPFMHSSAEVDSILLPTATMTNTNASWEVPEGTARTATVVYVPKAGNTVGSNTVTSSRFKGQLVGEGDNAGAAAIGTWTLGDTAEGDLRGSFGAERAPDRPVTPPDTDDDGLKDEAMVHSDADVTDIVNDDGDITVGEDAAGDDIKVAAADLFADGGATVEGKNYVQDTKGAIETQIKLLDRYIALDDVDPDAADATANTGRENVWDAVETALGSIFGATFDADGDPDTTADNTTDVRILSDSVENDDALDYPQTNDGDPNDVSAKEELAEVLAGLASLDEFGDATDEEGVFDGDQEADNRLLGGESEEDVFNRVEYTIDIKYGNTDYTRFGAWVRKGSANAVTIPTYDSGEAGHTGQFAYSPEEQTAGDGYPSGGSATYEGRTIARDTDGDLDVPVFYHGDIELQVSWEGPENSDGGDLTAIVSNLLDADGAMYNDGTDAVSMIIFAATNGSVDCRCRRFGASNRQQPTVRVRYARLSAPRRRFRRSGAT